MRSLRRMVVLWGMVALISLLPVQRSGLRAALPAQAAAPWVLYMEAEEGQVTAPLVRVDDVAASGCAYLYASGRDSGSVTLTFTVPADGDYYPWARVMGESVVNNSFYFSVDGDTPIKYEFLTFFGRWTWGWDRVHVQKQPQTTPLTLSAGQHTLTFGGREPAARLDAVLLTNDLGYLPVDIRTCPLAPSPTPTPVGGATPSATPSANPQATPTPFVVQMEAESGTVAAPMLRAQSPLASACGYVYAPERESGSVTLTFTVPRAGNYYPWARAMGTSLTNNSFWLSVDGSAPVWFEISYEYGDWTWLWHRLRIDLQQPEATPLVLSAGTHIFVFRGREADSRLDAVVVTDDPNYDPLFSPSSSIPCVPTASATRTATPMPAPSAPPNLTPLPFHLHLPLVQG